MRHTRIFCMKLWKHTMCFEISLYGYGVQKDSSSWLTTGENLSGSQREQKLKQVCQNSNKDKSYIQIDWVRWKAGGEGNGQETRLCRLEIFSKTESKKQTLIGVSRLQLLTNTALFFLFTNKFDHLKFYLLACTWTMNGTVLWLNVHKLHLVLPCHPWEYCTEHTPKSLPLEASCHLCHTPPITKCTVS